MFLPFPNIVFYSVFNKGYDVDKSFFITTTHKALDGRRRPLTTGPTRDSEGQEESAVTLVLVVKPRGVIEACYLEISEGQACGEETLDLFSDIKSVIPHPDPSAWEASRAYPFPLGGNSPRLCSQVRGAAEIFRKPCSLVRDFENRVHDFGISESSVGEDKGVSAPLTKPNGCYGQVCRCFMRQCRRSNLGRFSYRA